MSTPIRPDARRRGFSLIELLAGVTILLMIMAMLGAIFADTAAAWRIGTSRSDRTSGGRAALDFMIRELSSALVDEQLSMAVNSDAGDYFTHDRQFGYLSDAVFFLTAADVPETGFERATREVAYFVTSMRDSEGNEMPHRWRLVRAVRRNADKMRAYFDRSWALHWTPVPYKTVIENIAAFEIFTYGESSRRSESNWYSHGLNSGNPRDGMLPLYMEIYLEVLGEEDAIRAAAIAEGNEAESRAYARRRSKRYVARVNFENRGMHVENE